MSDVTLKVPADYREAFRAAVLSDLVFDATGAVKTFRTYSEQRLAGYPEDWKESLSLTDEDHQSSLRFVALTAELVVAFAEWELPGDIEIQGDPEAIYHALHELVSKFSGPMFAEALDTLPPEPHKVAHWSGLTDWGLKAMSKMDRAMRANQKERIEREAVTA